MASAYRRCARSTWPCALCATPLRGAAARACPAKSSARTKSAAAVSVILSMTRLARLLASGHFASTDCGSSASACSNKAIPSAYLSRDGGPPTKHSAPTKNVVHCVGVLGWSRGLRPGELDVERECDAARDLVVQREQITGVAVEMLSP